MSKATSLKAKRRRTLRFRFEIADPTEPQAHVLQAQMELLRAPTADARRDARQQLDLANAALEDCYGHVTLRALNPTVQQAFSQELAAAREQQRVEHQAAVAAALDADQEPPAEPDDPDPTWTADSYEVRFIAACDADRRSPQEWAQAFDDSDPDNPSDWTLEDRADLYELAVAVNTAEQPFDVGLLAKG